jgi:hypothetical protein
VAIELKSDTFGPHVEETFEVAPREGDTFEVVLSSCDETPFGSREEWIASLERVPFSLLFHAADRDRFHPQGIFALSHSELGEFELFLVPLGPDERGMRYEAVIS